MNTSLQEPSGTPSSDLKWTKDTGPHQKTSVPMERLLILFGSRPSNTFSGADEPGSAIYKHGTTGSSFRPCCIDPKLNMIYCGKSGPLGLEWTRPNDILLVWTRLSPDVSSLLRRFDWRVVCNWTSQRNAAGESIHGAIHRMLTLPTSCHHLSWSPRYTIRNTM